MRPFIVGGEKADIKDFPHSAYMFIEFYNEAGTESRAWICGASVLNEWMLLTAAHCFDEVIYRRDISTFVGNAEAERGVRHMAESFLKHENYSNGPVSNDIALVKLRSRIHFHERTKRIVLVEGAPLTEPAVVAGWGEIDVSTICVVSLNRGCSQTVSDIRRRSTVANTFSTL